MSLNTLSTELDLLVLNFLDRSDLATVCRVSKNYLQTAQPLPYCPIPIETDISTRARWLLLTLVTRRNLAAYTKSITVTRDERKMSNLEDYRYAELQQEASALQRLKSQALGLDAKGLHTGLQLMNSLHSDCSTPAALALIIYLTVNIETISYSCSLGADFASYPQAFSGKRTSKFGTRMRHLEFSFGSNRANAHAFLTPSLETLSIKKCKLLNVLLPLYCLALEKLRTLEFEDNPCVNSINSSIRRGRIPNLTRFVIRHSFPRSLRDYQALVHLLQKHCPKLESLHITDDAMRFLTAAESGQAHQLARFIH